MLSEFLQGSTMWGVGLTLAAFAVGTLINRVTKKSVCNPLLLGSLVVVAVLTALRIPYAQYKASAAPVSWLLLPATVSLAVPLYEKWDLLRRNAKAILAGIAAGTLTSLASVLLIGWAMGLDHTQFVTLLPKSVTTAISMDVSAELGGIASLTGAVVILTGIVGSLFGEGLFRLLRITDPMAKGVAMGTAAHAIGTSRALEMGETEGAMSGLSIAVAGIMTAILAPVFAGLL